MDRRTPGVLPWCKGWKCFSMSFNFISFIQDDYIAFGSLYTQKFMEKLFYNFILFARVVSQPWKGATRLGLFRIGMKLISKSQQTLSDTLTEK